MSTDRTRSLPEARTEPHAAADPSRRQALSLAAGVGAIGLLAACGGGDTTAEPDAGGSGNEADTPSETGSSSPEGGDGGGAGSGGALVAAAEVPVGGGVILDQQKVVVTQPTKGTFKGFTAICTHQSCTVASVKNGTISCACHGSSFSATDGSVKTGPATRPLREVAVTVEGDQVVES
ncbi:MAG: Rieske (2Fe-2S) protein [Sporichthyaceae bacterium]|nr:Rieske (2Fe-2S) protein [Sporichthyaceae bacterium]